MIVILGFFPVFLHPGIVFTITIWHLQPTWALLSRFEVPESSVVHFFFPILFSRNQVMRKKLILFFKRRNHARKQRVILLCFCKKITFFSFCLDP